MLLQKTGLLFLMGLSLLVSSCAGFPELHPYILSLKNGQCGQYQEVKSSDVCNVQFVFVKWVPVAQCEGFFALPPEDIAALRSYQAGQCSKP